MQRARTPARGRALPIGQPAPAALAGRVGRSRSGSRAPAAAAAGGEDPPAAAAVMARRGAAGGEGPPAAAAGGQAAVQAQDPLITAAAAALAAIPADQQVKIQAQLAKIQAADVAADAVVAAAAAPAPAPAPVIVGGVFRPNCLPDPANEEERGWKRTLFYILGYCDTFHDFSKPRSTEDQGKSINPKLIANRTTYIHNNIINKMDGGFNWVATYYTPLDGFRLVNKYGTFENAMFGAFTKMKKNPFFDGLPGDAQTYIKGLLGTDNLIVQTLDEESFKGNKPERHSSSTILEMTAPTVVYSEAWRTNFVQFLKDLYPSCVVGGIINFVEDAAAFPRNILTGTNPHFGNFNKIKTIQTMWDPAGLSQYENISEPPADRNIIAAPSFLALNKQANAGGAEFDPSVAKFNQTEEKLILGATEILVKKAGPSVNHLFMHMMYHSPPAEGIKAADKKSIENMITRAALDSKAKNTTYKLRTIPQGSVVEMTAAVETELRRLTSSKRSGDYENIHSAMTNNALLFTGDEPAFTYAVMNRQPAIYHTCSAAGHFFRFFAPLTLTLQDIQTDSIFQKTLTNASELEKFLGVNVTVYKELLTNIYTYTEPGTLKIKGDPLAGYLLQAIIIHYFNTALDSILTATKLLNQSYIGSVSEEYRNVIVRLIEILKNIPKNPTAEQKAIVQGIRAQQQHSIAALQQSIAVAENTIEETRKYLPRNFIKDNIKTKPTRAAFFIPSSELSATAIYQQGQGVKKYVMYAPLTYIPQSAQLAQTIGVIATQILQIRRTEDDATKLNVRKSQIQAIREMLQELDCPANIIALFPEGSETVSQITAAVGGALSPIENIVTIIRGDFRLRKVALEADVQGGGKREKKQKRSTTRKQSLPINYLAMAKSIEANLKGKELAMGFTPETYAAAIVDRVQCLEALEKAFGKQKIKIQETIDIPLVVEDYPFQKGKPVIHAMDANENPLPLVQSGGVRHGAAPLKSFMINFYTTKIEPFLNIHFKANSNIIFFNSLLESIYAGTFIVDMFSVLHEVAALPEADIFEGAPARYGEMRTRADEALSRLYSAIIECKENATKLVLRKSFGNSFATVEMIRTIPSVIESDPSSICDKLYSLCTFLGNIILKIQTQGQTVIYKRGRETYFKNRYAEVCQSILLGEQDIFTNNEKRKKVFNTIKYPFLEWYTLQYESTPGGDAAAAPVAPAAPVVEEAVEFQGAEHVIAPLDEGNDAEHQIDDLLDPNPLPAPEQGGHGYSRRHRRKRYSPRRRSLKNRR